MSNFAVCRVCLACNTKMHHIANTPYQEILEKLATELYTEDGRPETVCWVCLSALRRGRWLADTARAAHEILTQLSLSGIQLSEDTLSMLDQKFLCKLAWTKIQTLSIGKEFLHSPIKVEIKEDPSENEEISGFITKDEQINSTLSEDESFTVKKEEIFCDNITISENDDDKYEQINSTLSEDESFTVKNKEIFCDNLIISENKQCTSDIGNYQCTENRSSKNNVSKTHAENRSKLKRSSEVTVKDQKGRDCVRHICPTCDKTYKQRCHLLRHLKTHSKTTSQPSEQPPKDVICESCGKGFANNYTLKKHLLAHQDVRNFACAHCPIKLVQKSDLIRHMRTHTGQKPYKCDICDKQYSQKDMLVRHMRIHTGETPYSCNRCSLKFNRHSSMVRHVKRRHLTSDRRRYKGQLRP